VVDKRFAFAAEDKEQFRIHMRMMENFSGCRVLAYCVMSNHFHLLLEVTPKPKVAFTDEQLLKRLGALYSKEFVATVAKELADARQLVAQSMVADGEAYVQRIHKRFTYRMHDLSEYMNTLLQRFTRWHNKRTKRRGNLWEETFKSVVVVDGLFKQCRERFGPKRKSGARRMRGKAGAGGAECLLWSARDLRAGIE
jgi:REP element-mobilizing transposase RayT